MFEIGFAEVLLILIIGLVVIGPERLPEVAKGIGSMVGKIRAFIDNVRNESSLQQEIADLRRQLDMSKEVNEIRDLGTTLQNSLAVTETEINRSIYDRPSTEQIRQDFREQQAIKTGDDDLDLSNLQRPTFGREQYETLPPWYHERSDGALAVRAPSIPEQPTQTIAEPATHVETAIKTPPQSGTQTA